MGIPEGKVKRDLIWKNNGQKSPNWREKCTYKFKKLNSLMRINPTRSTSRHIIYPSHAAVDGPLHFSHGVWNTQSWWCTWGSLMYTINQNKGMLIVLETRKDIPTQVEKPWTDYVCSLFLGKEVFQVHDPFLYGWMRVE